MTPLFDVRLYDSLGSTNDEARRLAQAGAAHGTVVAARQQTAGRGRVGRSWVSPPGNLYLSVLLRLDLPLARLAELSFVAALAVADMVDSFLPPDFRAALKWPNDVLVEGAKISGILIEQGETATIVGIGVNVGHCPTGTPYPVTSLVQQAARVNSLSPRLRGERVEVRGGERAESPRGDTLTPALSRKRERESLDISSSLPNHPPRLPRHPPRPMAERRLRPDPRRLAGPRP